jgi:HAE1 family hydrophobic/amphiphilic exporter-1
MFKKIITFFIDRPLIGYFIYGTVFLVFLMIMPQMYREYYPAFDTPYMYVRTYYPGASAQEIETKITNKLEKKLSSIPNIETTVSYSQQHVSIIIVRANSRLNPRGIEKAQKQIKDEIQNIKDLPFGSLPPVLEIVDTETPVIRLALVQKNNDETLLNKTYTDFENKLRTLKNIGKITKFGVPQKQILVELDPYKLKQFGISGYDVIESLSLNLQNFPSGAYYQNLTNYNVIGFGEITDLNQLKNHTLIANDNGGKTTLSQLGEIRFNLQPEEHFFKINC